MRRFGPHLLHIPSRGLVIAYSRNTESQTIEEAQANTYSSNRQPILHLRKNCSGMNNPRVHFLPSETCDLFRWCGNCAQYGAALEMPEYCPCCNMPLGAVPGAPIRLVQYAKHVMTREVNLVAPITPTSTCNECYQRAMLAEMKRYNIARTALRNAGMAGNEAHVGDWFGRLVRRDPYFGSHL